MKRSLGIMVVCLLWAEPARADFTLVADAASFNANDSARWDGGHPMELAHPLVSQTYGVVMPWSALGQSNPYYDTIVTGAFGGLFIGTLAEAAAGGGTAAFQLSMSFDPTSPPVLGIAFQSTGIGLFTNLGIGGEEITATDVLGNVQTFNLGNDYGLFLGIESTVPLASISLVDSHTSVAGGAAESSFHDIPIYLDVATPAPPGFILAGLGLLGLPFLTRKRS